LTVDKIIPMRLKDLVGVELSNGATLTKNQVQQVVSILITIYL